MPQDLDTLLARAIRESNENPNLAEFCHAGLELRVSSQLGRHLVLLAPVDAGELLLCEEAFVAAPRSCLTNALRVKLSESSAAAQNRILSLFDGKNGMCQVTPETFPRIEPSLMHTKGNEGVRVEDNIDRLNSIVAQNCFGCSTLPGIGYRPLPEASANMLVQGTPDKLRCEDPIGGVWVWASFVSHSCLPNVQHKTIGKWIVFRAAKHMGPGTVLYDAYIDIVQPVYLRQDRLANYGFKCQCQRCIREFELLKPENFSGLARQLGTSPTFHQYRAATRTSVDQVQAISSANATRYDCAALDFQTQLLGAFFPFLQAHAMLAEIAGELQEALGMYCRIESVIAQIQPNSDLHAQVANSICRCLWNLHEFELQPGFAALKRTLVVHKRTYGGDASLWKCISTLTGELPASMHFTAHDCNRENTSVGFHQSLASHNFDFSALD